MQFFVIPDISILYNKSIKCRKNRCFNNKRGDSISAKCLSRQQQELGAPPNQSSLRSLRFASAMWQERKMRFASLSHFEQQAVQPFYMAKVRSAPSHSPFNFLQWFHFLFAVFQTAGHPLPPQSSVKYRWFKGSDNNNGKEERKFIPHLPQR